jgi:fatty acid amide hydrolase 2
MPVREWLVRAEREKARRGSRAVSVAPTAFGANPSRRELGSPVPMVVTAEPARLTERSATELAAAIRRREVSAREVVEAHISLLEQWGPRINAVVVDRFDEARAEGDAVDERVAEGADGESLPPLLGVPCTIKESIAVEGMPSCAGVVARREHRCSGNAPSAGRLLDAGAILLGLTNVSELTMWVETENRVYGRTSNPYDPSRTAGGSSGGEGAAIGSGGSPIGLGSDLGGSIRLPAFFNGVFGHKPSLGVVPLSGLYPAAAGETMRLAVCGPLARHAEDLMPVLRIIAGPDGEDPIARDVELGDPDEVSLRDLRVVLSDSATLAPTSRELLAARERAAGALAAAGARLERVSMRSMLRALEMYLTTLNTAAGVTLRELLTEAGAEPGWRATLRRRGPHTVATNVILSAERLARLVPTWRTRRVMAARDAFVDELRETIGEGVLLHPPAPKAAPRHGRTVGRLWWIHPMLVFNLAALPVTQVPLGLSARGLPLGVQVAAGPERDHVSIAVALELERVFGGWVPPRPPS